MIVEQTNIWFMILRNTEKIQSGLQNDKRDDPFSDHSQFRVKNVLNVQPPR